MSDRVLLWAIRIGWAAVPFTVWPELADALHRHSDPVRATAAGVGWAVWAVVLLGTLAVHPIGLMAVRCVAPAVVVATLVAVAGGRPSGAPAALAVAWAVVVMVVVFLPETGVAFVNGPAYPNERRYLLGVPAPLLLGPIELAWAALVGLPVVAAGLLATRQWVAGGIVAAAAVPAGWLFGRALYRLTRRWVVFVPAGLVLHDYASLAEPVLFRRQQVQSLGPAPLGTDSLDLTQRALGLALELQLVEKVEMSRITPAKRDGERGSSARLLFTPTRPGRVLAEAAARHLRVAVPPPSTASPS